MENNYKEYLNSYAWKAIKQVKLSEHPECECCWEPATIVHHLSYERRWSEKEEDIVSICERCHHECHFVNGYQIKNDEEMLRKRFEEVRDEFWHGTINNYEILMEQLKPIWQGLYDDGKNIYYYMKNWYEEHWNEHDDYINSLERKSEWWDGPENNWLYHPAYDWYDYDSYVNQSSISKTNYTSENDFLEFDWDYIFKDYNNDSGSFIDGWYFVESISLYKFKDLTIKDIYVYWNWEYIRIKNNLYYWSKKIFE